MTLVPVDPTNELAVSDYLTRARDWLATAVERTGPTEIAAAKAEIATAAEATKQLGLSKEIQDDAKEMVRRAEYALGKAIKKGQEDGTVAKATDTLRQSPSRPDGKAVPSPSEFVREGRERDDIYGMAAVGPDGFDRAINQAKDEGNLSRSNVARLARQQADVPARTASRRPLPEFARDAGWDLRKSVERLERIAADDRFGTNKEQVATHLRSHLTNAIEVCQDLLDRINNN
jgi:hypothetical protein